jgi:hypothetical protein
MEKNRCDFLTAAATLAAGAAAVGTPAQRAATEHDHQDLPSDPALRVKSLESLLIEKDW